MMLSRKDGQTVAYKVRNEDSDQKLKSCHDGTT